MYRLWVMDTTLPLRRPVIALIIGAVLLIGGCSVVGGPIVSVIPLVTPPSTVPVVPASLTPAGQGPTASPPPEATGAPTPPPVAHIGVTGHITAAPTCPVETVPPDPACAPGALAGATVVAKDSAGHEIARAVSNSSGYYFLDLTPGTYLLVPQPMGQMMRAPSARTVSVGAGASGGIIVDFTYDTGIR